MSYEDVRKILRGQKAKYATERRPNKGCMPEVAWDIMRAAYNANMRERPSAMLLTKSLRAVFLSGVRHAVYLVFFQFRQRSSFSLCLG